MSQMNCPLQMAGVGFSYDRQPVLEEISAAFQKGRFYAVLGPNGCGKTTLLGLMSGLLVPDRGQITLQGCPVGSWPRRMMARQMAQVSQQYDIHFPFTVSEVVMMGRHPWISRFSRPDGRDLERVERVMVQTGIEPFRDRRITDLSGGERQRCVVARALCQDTPILLLDEAFSSMDINHTLSLLKLIRREMKEKERTVVAVLHDINLASAWADHLVFISSGRVAAQGPVDEMMDADIIKAVFKVDAHVDYHPYTDAKLAFFKGEKG